MSCRPRRRPVPTSRPPTERLWRGDPPELWEAAQRLLDLGLSRHDVVHALIDAVGEAGQDAKAIRRALSDLPPEPIG